MNGDKLELANALKHLGGVERRPPFLRDAANETYSEASKLYRELEMPLEAAWVTRHIGINHEYAERLAKAEAYYDESLALFREHAEVDSLDYANTVRYPAVIKNRLGKREESTHLWEEAARRYDEIDLSVGLALPWHRLEAQSIAALREAAREATGLGQRERALDILRPATAARIPDAELWLAAGRMFDVTGEWEEAERAYRFAHALGLGRPDAEVVMLARRGRRADPLAVAREFASRLNESGGAGAAGLSADAIEKKTTCCGFPLSVMVKSSILRSLTGWPRESLTTTLTSTSRVETRNTLS
jgi:tetratricopeptide (TPR) repeat protein